MGWLNFFSFFLVATLKYNEEEKYFKSLSRFLHWHFPSWLNLHTDNQGMELILIKTDYIWMLKSKIKYLFYLFKILLCFYGNFKDSIRLTETLWEKKFFPRFNKGYLRLWIYFENHAAKSQQENITQLSLEP